MLKLLRPFQLCVIDEFAADLDIFSRKVCRFYLVLGITVNTKFIIVEILFNKVLVIL